jgi:hypothetical protein
LKDENAKVVPAKTWITISECGWSFTNSLWYFRLPAAAEVPIWRLTPKSTKCQNPQKEHSGSDKLFRKKKNSSRRLYQRQDKQRQYFGYNILTLNISYKNVKEHSMIAL